MYLPTYEDVTECSETSAYKIQTQGNYPEKNMQHTEHGGSLKSRIKRFSFPLTALEFEGYVIFVISNKCRE
jgi:hypothetical protein